MHCVPLSGAKLLYNTENGSFAYVVLGDEKPRWTHAGYLGCSYLFVIVMPDGKQFLACYQKASNVFQAFQLSAETTQEDIQSPALYTEKKIRRGTFAFEAVRSGDVLLLRTEDAAAIHEMLVVYDKESSQKLQLKRRVTFWK